MQYVYLRIRAGAVFWSNTYTERGMANEGYLGRQIHGSAARGHPRCGDCRRCQSADAGHYPDFPRRAE